MKWLLLKYFTVFCVEFCVYIFLSNLLLLYNNQNNIAFNRENLRFIADRFILIENLSTTDNQQDNTIINKDQTKIIRKSIIRLHSEYHISNLIMYLLKKIFN